MGKDAQIRGVTLSPPDAIDAHQEAHVLLARLVAVSPICGVYKEARALAAALSPAEQAPLLATIRRAFEAASDPQRHTRISILDTVEHALRVADGAARAHRDRHEGPTVTTMGDAIADHDRHADPMLSPSEDPVAHDVTGEDRGEMPHETSEEREAVERRRRQPMAVEPERSKRGAWAHHVDELGARKLDGRLIEIAIREEFAGSQTKLSELSGLPEETISRVKHGRRTTGSSDAARAWLVAYLKDPERPPPPLPRRPGPRPRAVVAAPKVPLTKAEAAAFEAKANLAREDRPRAPKLGQRAVLEHCLVRFLAAYPSGTDLPKLARAPSCSAWVRPRVNPSLIAAFDDRIGGPEKRNDYIRAAVAAYLAEITSYDKAAAFEEKPVRTKKDAKAAA